MGSAAETSAPTSTLTYSVLWLTSSANPCVILLKASSYSSRLCPLTSTPEAPEKESSTPRATSANEGWSWWINTPASLLFERENCVVFIGSQLGLIPTG